MTRFSFIIPVYNSKRYLKRCIESITAIPINNTDIEYEIILVDDGSTDGSDHLCDQIVMESKKNEQIRVFHQNNRGVSAARNKGIDLARGDYIIFIDSDDVINSYEMGKILEQTTTSPDVDMAVYGISFDYYLRGICFRRDEMLPPFMGITEQEVWMQKMPELFSKNVLSALWNKVIRKSLLDAHHFRLKENMIILEDLEFSLRLMEKCDRILFWREPVYHYIHEGHVDNAGNRVRKAAPLSDVLHNIEDAMEIYPKSLFETKDKDRILITIYENLLREGISFSTVAEIKKLCNDFEQWIAGKSLHNMIENDLYLMMVYEKKAGRLFLKSKRSRLRHWLANYIKLFIGDFRKWRC